ncbi:uncharacterized protein MONBRDRAFT_28465 [Monosiga brevicollis MX1]|uniref:Uncharacterized protein n=1 Tax=Monosiga brevicollis TaxID=81824 RepID=A9V890_MONBE|nr:uncharacterized protein MONBRDRAFT_28465 [Monosiga brevicollis MX1]EDQ86297.1 predicted protein [Monosiga brevicollis MX1]|eukprot:XP_001748967.1 hypothetical protein [Monosiga brevicollis MX1]
MEEAQILLDNFNLALLSAVAAPSPTPDEADEAEHGEPTQQHAARLLRRLERHKSWSSHLHGQRIPLLPPPRPGTTTAIILDCVTSGSAADFALVTQELLLWLSVHTQCHTSDTRLWLGKLAPNLTWATPTPVPLQDSPANAMQELRNWVQDCSTSNAPATDHLEPGLADTLQVEDLQHIMFLTEAQFGQANGTDDPLARCQQLLAEAHAKRGLRLDLVCIGPSATIAPPAVLLPAATNGTCIRMSPSLLQQAEQLSPRLYPDHQLTQLDRVLHDMHEQASSSAPVHLAPPSMTAADTFDMPPPADSAVGTDEQLLDGPADDALPADTVPAPSNEAIPTADAGTHAPPDLADGADSAIDVATTLSAPSLRIKPSSPRSGTTPLAVDSLDTIVGESVFVPVATGFLPAVVRGIEAPTGTDQPALLVRLPTGGPELYFDLTAVIAHEPVHTSPDNAIGWIMALPASMLSILTLHAVHTYTHTHTHTHPLSLSSPLSGLLTCTMRFLMTTTAITNGLISHADYVLAVPSALANSDAAPVFLPGVVLHRQADPARASQPRIEFWTGVIDHASTEHMATLTFPEFCLAVQHMARYPATSFGAQAPTTSPSPQQRTPSTPLRLTSTPTTPAINATPLPSATRTDASENVPVPSPLSSSDPEPRLTRSLTRSQPLRHRTRLDVSRRSGPSCADRRASWLATYLIHVFLPLRTVIRSESQSTINLGQRSLAAMEESSAHSSSRNTLVLSPAAQRLENQRIAHQARWQEHGTPVRNRPPQVRSMEKADDGLTLRRQRQHQQRLIELHQQRAARQHYSIIESSMRRQQEARREQAAVQEAHAQQQQAQKQEAMRISERARATQRAEARQRQQAQQEHQARVQRLRAQKQHHAATERRQTEAQGRQATFEEYSQYLVGRRMRTQAHAHATLRAAGRTTGHL